MREAKWSQGLTAGNALFLWMSTAAACPDASLDDPYVTSPNFEVVWEAGLEPRAQTCTLVLYDDQGIEILREVRTDPEPCTHIVTSVAHIDGNGTLEIVCTNPEGDTANARGIEYVLDRPECDLTQDARCGIPDVNAFVSAFGSSVGDSDWNPAADYDGDGRVGIGDFNRFIAAWF